MIDILFILLALCMVYVMHLKTRLNIAEYNLNSWREMVVFVNGKQRLLND